MGGNLRLFILAALLLLFPVHAAEFSSENVKEIAKVYSDQDEAFVIPSQFKSLQYNGETFWFAYFTPQDSTSKNLVLVIRQEGNSGVLELREDVLKVLYAVDYDLETLTRLKENGIGFEDLKNVIDSLKFQIDNTELPVIDNIKRQSTEDMTRVDDALFGLQTSTDDALSRIQEGMDYYENFQASAAIQDVIIADLDLVMQRYTESLDYIHAFAGKEDNYQKALSEKRKEVTDPSVAAELSKLGNLKVKDAVVKSYNASLAQKRKILPERKAAREKAIVDMINSLFYRKARKDAQTAYEGAQKAGMIESLLSARNELSLKDCRLSNSDLKKRWEAIRSVMDPTQPVGAEEYGRVPEKVAQAEQVAQNLNTRLNSCLNSTPTPTPEPEGSDYRGVLGPIILVIIVILAAYYLNGYMKRKPEDAEE
ncbi:MAG TPA: hypothetical protein VJI13_03375 [Candidatus Norongarragalinales archaeon]|nr:hypothetical protein [Candidatus Norongarragalinales archaeon]